MKKTTLWSWRRWRGAPGFMAGLFFNNRWYEGPILAITLWKITLYIGYQLAPAEGQNKETGG